MNLCSHNHEEICFETRECPLCEMKSDLEKTIIQLEEAVASLEKELKDTQSDA